MSTLSSLCLDCLKNVVSFLPCNEALVDTSRASESEDYISVDSAKFRDFDIDNLTTKRLCFVAICLFSQGPAFVGLRSHLEWRGLGEEFLDHHLPKTFRFALSGSHRNLGSRHTENLTPQEESLFYDTKIPFSRVDFCGRPMDKHIPSFAEQLKKNSNLSSLYLCNSGLSRKSIQILALAVKENHQLKLLDLQNDPSAKLPNEVDDGAARDLVAATKDKPGFKLRLQGHSISDQLKQDLLASMPRLEI